MAKSHRSAADPELHDDGMLEVPRDPAMTERANAVMAEEMRIATDADDVELTGDGSGKQADPSGTSDVRDNRLFIGIVGGIAVVVLVVVALSTDQWIFVPIAFVIMIVAGALYLRDVMNSTTEVEKPSADTVAVLEDEGVSDPEAMLNDKLERVAGGAESSDTTGGGTDREANPDEDPAQSFAEQRHSWTPTEEASDATNAPGSDAPSQGDGYGGNDLKNPQGGGHG